MCFYYVKLAILRKFELLSWWEGEGGTNFWFFYFQFINCGNGVGDDSDYLVTNNCKDKFNEDKITFCCNSWEICFQQCWHLCSWESLCCPTTFGKYHLRCLPLDTVKMARLVAFSFPMKMMSEWIFLSSDICSKDAQVGSNFRTAETFANIILPLEGLRLCNGSAGDSIKDCSKIALPLETDIRLLIFGKCWIASKGENEATFNNCNFCSQP